MPNFDNFIPRANLPISREGSRLHSPRESNGQLHDWRNIQSANTRADQITRTLSQIQRQVAKLSQRDFTTSGFHPFKIYQFPSYMRIFHPDDEPYRVKVRSGRVHAPSGWTSLPGTDFYAGFINPFFAPSDWEIYTTPSEFPPGDNTTISGTWHEAVVPSDGTPVYFWVTALGLNPSFGLTASYQLIFGKSPSDCIAMSDGSDFTDDWSAFPNDDPYHTLIGGAMFQVSPFAPTIPQLQIFQYVRTDIEFGASINGSDGSVFGSIKQRFCGEWSSAGLYFAGDVVTKTVGDFVELYILYPPTGTSYPIWDGPIQNVDPSLHTPDPWSLLSNSPTATGMGWQNGPFDGSKFYLQKP